MGRVVIAGGTGFLGENLARHLTDQGWEVVVIARHAPDGAASWMVRLAALLMLRSDPDLALYGRYCVSRRLKEEGFEFLFPDVRSALQDLYRS